MVKENFFKSKKSLDDSETKKNLLEAFLNESQAYTKYCFFSSQAKKDGFEQIAGFFKDTADNEKEHAKIYFKILYDGKINSTQENLLDAADGEKFEHDELYKKFAQTAEEEGYDDIAYIFREVAKIEKTHEERYRKLLDNIKNNQTFVREEKVVWRCRNCGNLHESNKAPEICSVCQHPKSYFEILKYNY
ncbi:MAG: rubrerythrin family protein [Clostridiales bacterium]|jgi:rubrerythrin|nr:rubrerythrin family protein [Clostridiales bacterium]